MTDEAVKIVISADAAQVQPAVQQAQTSVQALSSSIKDQFTSVGQTAAIFDKYRSSVGQVAVVSQTATNSVKKVATGMETAGHASAGFYRELIVLGHEFSQGRFSRFGGSLAVLAERSGNLTTIFQTLGAVVTNPVTVSFVAFSAALIAVGVHSAEVSSEIAKIGVQLQAVSNPANFSAATIQQYIDSLSELAGISRKEATEAWQILASSTHATADEFQRAQQIMPNLTAVLGDASTAAKFLKEAMDDPAKAAKTLEERFGTLTAAEYLTIQRMTEMGDRAGAANVVFEALQRTTKDLHDTGLTPLGAKLEFVKGLFSDLIGLTTKLTGYLDTFTNGAMAAANALGMIKKPNFGPTNDEFQKGENQAVVEGLELARQSNAESLRRQEIEGKILQLKKDQTIASRQGNQQAVADLQQGIVAYQKELQQLNNKDASAAKTAQRNDVEAWQASLTEKLERLKIFGEQARQEEIKFWQAKKNIAGLGAEQYRQINEKLYALESQQYAKDEAAFKETERKKLEDAKQIESQINANLKQLNTQRVAAQKQALKTEEADWKGLFSSVTTSFNSAVGGMITGTQTFGQAVGSIFTGLLQGVLGIFEKMAEQWLVQEIFQKATTEAGAASTIAAYAAQAGAGAYAATAIIPVVGPELAPAAASTAYSEALAFEGLASFDVGAWNLPHDMVAQVHKGESIVPANFAEGMRQNGGFGGGGGDVHVHVNAIDRRGFESWLKGSGGALVKSLAHQGRNNNPGLAGLR